jgi:hypothetical protein
MKRKLVPGVGPENVTAERRRANAAAGCRRRRAAAKAELVETYAAALVMRPDMRAPRLLTEAEQEALERHRRGTVRAMGRARLGPREVGPRMAHEPESL